MAFTIKEGFPKIMTMGGGLKMEITILTAGAQNDSYTSKLTHPIAGFASFNGTGFPTARVPLHISDGSSNAGTGRNIKLPVAPVDGTSWPLVCVVIGR